MKYLQSLLLALAAVPSFAVAGTIPRAAETTTDVNPFLGKEFYANKGYAKKLEETISRFQNAGDTVNAARARSIQKVGTFSWISSTADIASIKPLIREANLHSLLAWKSQVVQLAVYNLPERDCAAKASAGELSLDDDGLNKYKAFIDKVAHELSSLEALPLTFAIILEPDSLGNVVTNLSVEKCAKAAPAYKEGISYAIKKLQQKNVHLYLDAAHGGWLGWDGNLAPTAELFAEVLKGAGPGARVRGVATNVSNYNQYNATVREPYTEWNNAWDELHYAQVLAPHLTAAGYPAHFIIDQGRSGQAGLRSEWGAWCNLKGAGYGIRPTTETNEPVVDAIVWVKPGGESDGTSDPTAARFDEVCAGPAAHIPAPEAGSWFSDYVVELVQKADPPIEPTFV
ncbi:cellobiohydrolase [Pluteus cervinus]|uniref:Cellobiohydrolase n=1 Tax=Pluteus cervinus TaxID=181527 RepID=A0ACD3AGN0_9AGAR|nr:cellobiohydrolase [Pluteus cervinus]